MKILRCIKVVYRKDKIRNIRDRLKVDQPNQTKTIDNGKQHQTRKKVKEGPKRYGTTLSTRYRMTMVPTGRKSALDRKQSRTYSENTNPSFDTSQ